MGTKLITAIIPGHKSMIIIEKLKNEMNIITANKYSARGETLVNKEDIEMETLTILVDEKEADKVFEFVFFEAELNKAHQGMIFQQSLKKSSTYKL